MLLNFQVAAEKPNPTIFLEGLQGTRSGTRRSCAYWWWQQQRLMSWSCVDLEGDYGRDIEVPSDTNISSTVKTQVVLRYQMTFCLWACDWTFVMVVLALCRKCWLYGETTTSCFAVEKAFVVQR